MDPVMLAIIGAAVALMIWSSNRSKKQRAAAVSFRDSLAPGQEVMTGSGLFGTVVEIDEERDRVTLESGGPGGARSEWLRAAIAKLVVAPEEEIDPDDSEAAETTEASQAEVDDVAAQLLGSVDVDEINEDSATDDGAEEDPKNKA